jgi:tetratricopeptide (TPR) repeat protein
VDRSTIQTPEQQAAAHLAAGRPKAALDVIAPVASAPDASHTALSRHAAVLKALGRMDECLAVRRIAAQRFPDSGVAWHNLASALGDIGLAAEAVSACERAFRAGIDAPETWLVHGRALAGAGRLEDAIAALDAALVRRARYPEALAEKARIVWAATGEVEQAAAVYGADPAHTLTVAELYRSAGESGRAMGLVETASRAAPGDAGLLQMLAGLALDLSDDVRAAAAAAEALRLAPDDPNSMLAFAVSALADGRSDEALAQARRLAALDPLNHTFVALLAVAARLTGAPEYAALYNYEAFVRPSLIAPPPGWTSTAAYLVDLRASLEALHAESGQPLEQSLRGGTQTTRNLRSVDDPAIRGFFAAIEPLIARYIADLGPGDDPLRRRVTGGFAISDCWSIRLRSEGHHVDHMHPRGWLSSAFYVDVPPEVSDGEGREGWLHLGRPSWRTRPALGSGHAVKPVPGQLVLFPSYMWHGTTPFTAAGSRLTIAFDVVPA